MNKRRVFLVALAVVVLSALLTAGIAYAGEEAAQTGTVVTYTRVPLPPMAIPSTGSFGQNADYFTISGGGTIYDLNVYLDINHSYVGDLRITLVHLDTGTSATIFDRPGAPPLTFGCSGNDIKATLDDEAASPVESECAASIPAINGTFTPNNPLSVFDGESINGTWQLLVEDLASGDVGQLNRWSLIAEHSGTPFVGTFDVALTGSALPAVASVGDVVMWSFTVTNNSEVNETYGLTFRADVPEGLWPTDVAITLGGGVIRPLEDGTLWVDLDNIPPGGAAVIQVTTTVMATGPICVPIAVAGVGSEVCINALPGILPATGEAPLLWSLIQ